MAMKRVSTERACLVCSLQQQVQSDVLYCIVWDMLCLEDYLWQFNIVERLYHGLVHFLDCIFGWCWIMQCVYILECFLVIIKSSFVTYCLTYWYISCRAWLIYCSADIQYGQKVEDHLLKILLYCSCYLCHGGSVVTRVRLPVGRLVSY